MSDSKDATRSYGPALEKTYQFLLWLIPSVEKFPRSQKFLLGDRIQSTAIEMLEQLIEATYSRQRHAPLAKANLCVEKLRFLFRLSMDLDYLDKRRYEHAARNLEEIGRLIGGWLKANHAAQT